MGIFDKLRQIDRLIRDEKEDVQGEVQRVAAGVSWPRPSDPSGIDVLGAVTVDGHPVRIRSELSDASGWEFRERDVVELYDSVDEQVHKGRLVGVTWVEALHRPYEDDLDVEALVVPYGGKRWRTDADDTRHLSTYLPVPYLYGTVPSTGDPCRLLWVKPLVIRLRAGSLIDNRGYQQYGETRPLDLLSVAVLSSLDRTALARWVEALEPFRDQFDRSSQPTGRAMLGGALDAARATLSGELGRRSDGDDAPKGGLLGRVMGAAEDGASNALATKIFRGAGLGGFVDGSGARPRAEREEYRYITTLRQAERAQPGARWVALDDAALAAAVEEATGMRVVGAHDRIEDAKDCRYVEVDGGNAVTVTFLPDAVFSGVAGEVREAQQMGGWTIGRALEAGDVEHAVAVGRVDGLTMAVRVGGGATTLTALKLAKAVAALVGR